MSSWMLNSQSTNRSLDEPLLSKKFFQLNVLSFVTYLNEHLIKGYPHLCEPLRKTQAYIFWMDASTSTTCKSLNHFITTSIPINCTIGKRLQRSPVTLSDYRKTRAQEHILKYAITY